MQPYLLAPQGPQSWGGSNGGTASFSRVGDRSYVGRQKWTAVPRLGVWNAVLLMPCVTKALRTPLGKRGDALLSLLGFLVFERKFPKGKT